MQHVVRRERVLDMGLSIGCFTNVLDTQTTVKTALHVQEKKRAYQFCSSQSFVFILYWLTILISLPKGKKE